MGDTSRGPHDRSHHSSWKAFVVAHDPSGKLIQSPTNVAWGGPDLTDLYIGDLHTDYVLTAKSPVAGMPMLHQSET